jgi:hypothetical protein
MPTYDFECGNCATVCEQTMSMFARDALSENILRCPRCTEGILKQVIISCPMISIPGNMTHDGIHKIVGTPNTKQVPIIPLQLKEEMPDGSIKITTIGNKN